MSGTRWSPTPLSSLQSLSPPSSLRQRPAVTVALQEEEAEENSPAASNVLAFVVCTQATTATTTTTTTTITTGLSLYEQQQQQLERNQPLLTTMQIDESGANAAGVSGVVVGNCSAANDDYFFLKDEDEDDNEEEEEEEKEKRQLLMAGSRDHVLSPTTMTEREARHVLTRLRFPAARQPQRDVDGKRQPKSGAVDALPIGNLMLESSCVNHRGCAKAKDVRRHKFLSSSTFASFSSDSRCNAFQAPFLPAVRPTMFAASSRPSRSALRAQSSKLLTVRHLPLVYAAFCLMVVQLLSHLGTSNGAAVPVGFSALASGGGSGTRMAPVRSTLSPASAIEGMNPIMRYRLRLQFQERLRLLNQTLNRKRPTARRPTFAPSTLTTTPSTYISYSSSGGGSSRDEGVAATNADWPSQALINNISSAARSATAPLGESDAAAVGIAPGDALHRDGERARYESRNCFFSPIQCRLPVVEVQSANRHRQQQQHQANRERNGTHGGGGSAAVVHKANSGVQLVDSTNGDSLNIVGAEEVIPSEADEYVGGDGGSGTSVEYADAPLAVPEKRRFEHRVPSRRRTTAVRDRVVGIMVPTIVQRSGANLQHHQHHHHHGLRSPSRPGQPSQYRTPYADVDNDDEFLMFLLV